MMKKIFALLLLLTMTSACSQQNRDMDIVISAEKVMGEVERLASASVSVKGDASVIDQILEDPTLTVYYAESGIGMGPASSVFSFHELSWMGFTGEDVFSLGIDKAIVIFLDGFTEAGDRHFALMTEVTGFSGTENFISVSEAGDYAFTDDDFVTRMADQNGGTLILRTLDVDNETADELATNIKLSAYDEENGSEGLLGQFSFLAGFGGI
jgi:hypothetical protein